MPAAKKSNTKKKAAAKKKSEPVTAITVIQKDGDWVAMDNNGNEVATAAGSRNDIYRELRGTHPGVPVTRG
jgi:hypothetical protein